jgi:hypothetical protein
LNNVARLFLIVKMKTVRLLLISENEKDDPLNSRAL